MVDVFGVSIKLQPETNIMAQSPINDEILGDIIDFQKRQSP